ncbi:unnamed protein product [Lathyrus sativus]|nr:unnamed protein product [Lathyrus sativus]
MQRDLNFNHHAKCERLHITNLTFVDDVLLFSKSDYRFVEFLLETLAKFSNSIGLFVNPMKCKVFFGGVDEATRMQITNLTNFEQGTFPFRYLGIPLTYKQLSDHYYMPLVDKIVGKIKHWSSHLLSYAGKTQLIRFEYFVVANFWMQCLPFPKVVIQKIDAILRSFLWTGKSDISRKSPISWKTICNPKKFGGLNIIELGSWNSTTMLKLLRIYAKSMIILGKVGSYLLLKRF